MLYRSLCVWISMWISMPALAWGPHSEIAQAALDTMGPNDPLVKLLGPDSPRLREYVWMADQRQQLVVSVGEVFYADDFLLFPDAPKHYQHICPEVQQTYHPYFRRALQALRTESTLNAARWIGSLLHFTTDTGSPPHALGILGPTHSKMENWLDARSIHLPGYQPKLLGEDDDSAEAGFLRRMDGLIAYSKERALRCKADVEADKRPLVEPVVLESALETARVTADLLHTLGVLAGKSAGGTGAALSGRIVRPKQGVGSLSGLPAKVILLGTKFSTLTAADDTFSFRHLPAGAYQVVVLVPGAVHKALPITLKNGDELSLGPIDLSEVSSGNLVRNGRFTLRWVSQELYDNWSQPKRPAKMIGNNPMRDWEGEWIPLGKDIVYKLAVRWKTGGASVADSRVFLRTKGKADSASLVTESAAATTDHPEVKITGSQEASWAQLCIRTPVRPDECLEEVSLRTAP